MKIPRLVAVIASLRLTPAQRYEERMRTMLLAIAEHDWHGLADQAMDMRELVAAHPELRKHEEKLWSRLLERKK